MDWIGQEMLKPGMITNASGPRERRERPLTRLKEFKRELESWRACKVTDSVGRVIHSRYGLAGESGVTVKPWIIDS